MRLEAEKLILPVSLLHVFLNQFMVFHIFMYEDQL